MPFVLESFGAFAAEGVQGCIKLLAEKTDANGYLSYNDFRSHAHFVLSTVLQQGNATASKIALHRYHLINFRSRCARTVPLSPELVVDEIPV